MAVSIYMYKSGIRAREVNFANCAVSRFKHRIIQRCYITDSGSFRRQSSYDLTSRYLCYPLNAIYSLSGGMKYSAVKKRKEKKIQV